jgi:putative ABC transport system permease protein
VAYKGADDFNSAQDARTLPASLVTRLEALPEVGAAYPQNTLQTVFVIGKNGKVVGGNGPPGLAFNTSGVRNIAGDPVLRLADGVLPSGPREIALDVTTAEKAGYSVGDSVKLVTPGTPPSMTATVTGLVRFGGGGLNGATITVFDTDFMHQEFFGGKDVYTSISLRAAPGVSQQALAAAAQQVLPDGVVAQTGDAKVKKDQENLDRILGFIRTFLLVFAGVALVVGIFLIINTFSILVAQRSRELALLRALGASRGQVNRSVLLEALAVGLIGSAAGLGLGYLLALLLKYVFGRFGLDLGDAAFPLTPSAVVASFLVGTVVTAVAGLLPARRASRVAPVTALRDDVALPEPALRRRSLVGAVLAVLGAGTMLLGFTRDGGVALSLIGLGILLVLVGISLTSALLGRPLIRLFGLGYRRLFGSVGSLATENSLRNPRRTAATASALMIGLALMSMMAIFGASASASTDDTVSKSLTSQFIVSNVVQQPFATSIADEIRGLDGVQSVAALKQGYPKIDGSTAFVGGVDPAVITDAVVLPMQQGSLADLGPGTVAVDATTAKNNGLHLGSTLKMKFQGGTVPVRVVALYAGGNALGLPYLVTDDTLLKGGLAPLDSLLFVTKEPGADTTTVRNEINGVLTDLPTVTVKDPEGFAAEQKTQINQFLSFIYGLLALSVLIAALGVVNTLSLSVIERTREVGLLRAVGVSRRQLRTMIRLESLAVAVFGAVLGLLMGTAFGLAVVRALHDEGLTKIQIPWATLAVFVLVAALIGVLAAVLPARRAARLDVLRAITAD